MQPNMIRAGLEQTVASLARDLPRLRRTQACARIAALRSEAVAQGAVSVATLASGLADALGRDGRAAPLAAWLDALGLAAECPADNGEIGPLLMATVDVRFAA